MAARIIHPSEISIGVICPLPIEVAAMMQMLDERYTSQRFPRDPNIYHLGRIREHNIVIAGLPDGITGIASATTVTNYLSHRFSSVKTLLLVGVGGGVPTISDVRLGDVVVSMHGVVQYDFGKSLSEGRFKRTGTLYSPPREVLCTLAAMKTKHLLNGAQLPDYLTYLESSQSNPNFTYPGAENDFLFDAGYDHLGGSTCAGCDKTREIKREPRKANQPIIHYGTIASANQLMRDSRKRDTYNRDYDNRILCFEMEAAGLMSSTPTPCLVIRGVSDYADSHKCKYKLWHGYAAATAAAVAKEFITTVPCDRLKTIPESLSEEGQIGALKTDCSTDSSASLGPASRSSSCTGSLRADGKARQSLETVLGRDLAADASVGNSYPPKTTSIAKVNATKEAELASVFAKAIALGNYHLDQKHPKDAKPQFEKAREILGKMGKPDTTQIVRVYIGLIYSELQMTYKDKQSSIDKQITLERHFSKAQEYIKTALEFARQSPDARDLLKVKLGRAMITTRDAELHAKTAGVIPEEMARLKNEALKRTIGVVKETERLRDLGVDVTTIARRAENWVAYIGRSLGS